jgi:hypothetical protein
MRFLTLLSLIALCTCQNGQVENLAQSPVELTPQAAKEAIAEFISSHPDAFVSLGRAEKAEDIRKVKLNPTSGRAFAVGMFNIDLDKKTYELTHGYGKHGEGWFEDWQWTGNFVLREGKWELSEPEFIKMWGE